MPSNFLKNVTDQLKTHYQIVIVVLIIVVGALYYQQLKKPVEVGTEGAETTVTQTLLNSYVKKCNKKHVIIGLFSIVVVGVVLWKYYGSTTTPVVNDSFSYDQN